MPLPDEPLSRATLGDRLLAEIPEFAPEVEDHLGLYGERLDHVLFGDLTRFVLAAASDGNWPLVERCLAFLDEAIGSVDPYVKSLVAVSFIENLPPWQAPGVDPLPDGLVDCMPVRLRAEFERQGSS